MDWTRVSSWALLLAAAACRTEPPAPPPVVPVALAAQVSHAPRDRVAASSAATAAEAIHFEVRGPSSVDFAATSVGLNGSEVAILARNTGATPRMLGPLRVRFAVRREGIAFRCEPHEDAILHEPRALAPGELFSFARTMHCWTPIPGRYEVDTLVAFGDEAYVPAGSFAMEVRDDASHGPRACPARPGLFAAMGGDRRSPPMPLRRDGRDGGYHAVVVIANGSARPVTGGPVKLAFRVTKKGSDVACGGETIARALPSTFAPGEVSVLHVPVTCIREVEGEYVVTGQLAFDEPVGSDALEIGRMGVRVTGDPLLWWPSSP